MTTYDERERAFYKVLALPETVAVKLVDRIVEALVQGRSRITMLTVVHWLPDEWQCLDDPDQMDFFHKELESQRAAVAADMDPNAPAAPGETRRIDRGDFSAELGGAEDDYRRAMGMLDFLDVRFYSSYITRTSGTVFVKTARKQGIQRSFFHALADLFQGRGTARRVVEYRIVLDLVLTLFTRRESALQLASAMRFGGLITSATAAGTGTGTNVSASASASASVGIGLGIGANSGRRDSGSSSVSTLAPLRSTGSGGSRSASVNIRSTVSAHSSEHSRSPNITVRLPERATSAASETSETVTLASSVEKLSSSSSSSPDVEILPPRQPSPPSTPKQISTLTLGPTRRGPARQRIGAVHKRSATDSGDGRND